MALQTNTHKHTALLYRISLGPSSSSTRFGLLLTRNQGSDDITGSRTSFRILQVEDKNEMRNQALATSSPEAFP